jgi:transcriptional regulator with XRE-family HTH domain
MARTREPNFLRAWREYRGLTQAKLAEAVDTTGAVISLLEAGERGLSDKWLRRLAPVLGATPGHLLDMDPHEVDHDLFEIFNSMPKEMQEQAKSVLRALRGEIAPKVEAPPPSPPVIERNSKRDAASEKAQQPKPRRGGKTPKGT